MKKHVFLVMLPAIIALSLLAAFILVTPSFAQDETPPDEIPVEEPAPDLETLAETGVEVVDASVEPVPLVEELVIVDPWFKVGTKLYEFTTADCNPDTAGNQPCSNPLQAAVYYISNNGKVPSDGFIHVDAGTLNNQEVYIDGIDPYIPSLKGIVGHVNPDTYIPDAILAYTADFGSSINVTNKMTGFTLSGLQIIGDGPGYGVVDITMSTGSILLQDLVVNSGYSGGAAIFINNHNGSITLKNVDSSDNAGAGAYINNSAGTSGVTITNSSFNNNNSWNSPTRPTGGLTIATRGAVSLSGVTAFGNTGGQPGLFIQQSGAITIKNSVFSENAGHGISNSYSISGIVPTASIALTNVMASNNDLVGMYLVTKGNISFTGVKADGNLNHGADLDTCQQLGGMCLSAGSGAITIKNSSFDRNHGIGFALYVYARGAITLTGVSASSGYDAVTDPSGAYLNNSYSDKVVPVKITSSFFDDNDSFGLAVYSTGAVTLSKVSASRNENEGVWIITNTLSTALVNISGTSSAYNRFSDNGKVGLFISSHGAVSIKHSDICENGDNGVEIDNTSGTAGVTISNAYINGNALTNLFVSSNGAIKLSYLEASESVNGMGAQLDNHGSASSPGVTISNAEFWNNYSSGLHVDSKGNIILTNTASLDNDGVAGACGAILVNTAGTGYVKITNAKSTEMDMKLGFSNNLEQGLEISTNGTVTLTNVNALDNQDRGVWIHPGPHKGVTLTNIRADDNGTYGILIATIGPVVISGGHANNNNFHGLSIHNTYAADALPKPVTIKNFTTNGNRDYGIYVSSKGAIALSGVTANDTIGSNLAAIWLENNVAGALIPAVTLSKVYASYNIYDGVYVLSNGAVKYSSGEASNNGNKGVFIRTLASITLSNVIGVGNGFHGAELLNDYSITHAPISVSGSTSTLGFSNNGGNGIRLQSMGAVTLKNITVDNNNIWGIHADNYQGGTGIGNFTVSNVTTRGNNGDDGLYITSNGIVTLNTVISMLNFDSGAIILAHNHNINIYNSVMTANQYRGIYANVGTGTFTISNTLYFGNDTVNMGSPNIEVIH